MGSGVVLSADKVDYRGKRTQFLKVSASRVQQRGKVLPVVHYQELPGIP